MTGVREWLPGREEATVTSAAVRVDVPANGSFGTVCRLVAAGVAGRQDVTVDRIDELQLAIDAALRQPAAADAVSLVIAPDGRDLRFEIGPFVPEARGEALDRILSTLVADATRRVDVRGAWVVLRVPLTTVANGSAP